LNLSYKLPKNRSKNWDTKPITAIIAANERFRGDSGIYLKIEKRKVLYEYKAFIPTS